ncbi:YaiI/YqxD family protein [Eubacterium coprostanoligenes]|uniref:YaiI/YqxD family protein n=1 Tax=Eubacterium coprostanoligenes TaxID=290054 RepID=UPI0023559BDE|nr:YaiI/YqxD family protein [Eubacterium coprostanoligenes]MCI6353919.1 YaiI/YqxD family protein [Eubacterium coprostanoligenes]MCI7264601.1 YaiI/YqxD family protein [Eubacterium coprostanoligenes]MDD7358158.1 YaiI/YqxD family protein [Eubacterium coprostanoligenes]
MKILIDADGCPVVKQATQIAKENNIEVVIFCDTSHIINSDYAQIITVSKGADSVDFALVNEVKSDDIVVTQDYGLAAMVLSKGGKAITQNGMIISDSNLELLLTSRYESKKARMSGAHLKGPKKRTAQNDEEFIKSFKSLICVD